MNTRYFEKMSKTISSGMDASDIRMIEDEIKNILGFEISRLDDLYDKAAQKAGGLIREIQNMSECMATQQELFNATDGSWVDAIIYFRSLGMLDEGSSSLGTDLSNKTDAKVFAERSDNLARNYMGALDSVHAVYEDTLNTMVMLRSVKRGVLCHNVLPLLSYMYGIDVSPELSDDGCDRWSLNDITNRLELCIDEMTCLERSRKEMPEQLICALYKRVELNLLGLLDSIGRYLVLNAYKVKDEYMMAYEASVYYLLENIRTNTIHCIENRELHGDIIELIDVLSCIEDRVPEVSSEDMTGCFDEDEFADDTFSFYDEDDSKSVDGDSVFTLSAKPLIEADEMMIDELCDYLHVCLKDADEYEVWAKEHTGAISFADMQIYDNIRICLLAMMDRVKSQITKEDGFQHGMIASLESAEAELERATRKDADKLFIYADMCLAHSRALHKESLKRKCLYINLSNRIGEALEHFDEYGLNDLYCGKEYVVDVIASVLNLEPDESDNKTIPVGYYVDTIGFEEPFKIDK